LWPACAMFSVSSSWMAGSSSMINMFAGIVIPYLDQDAAHYMTSM
jgi:hypothetical protein